MITLRVKKYRGRLVLLDENPTGVKLVMVKPKPMDDLTKQLRAMWREFDGKYKEDNDPQQQKLIRALALKHFSVQLTWAPAKNAEGWPTPNYWNANKRWINKEIKKLCGRKP